MLKKAPFALGAVAALSIFTLVPAFASDTVYPGGGTLAQVVDGGGTYSIITLINVDSVAIPYNLYFYADSGSALTLNTTIGSGSFFQGVLPVGGSTIIRTLDAGSSILQGYAVVTSQSLNCTANEEQGECQIAGSTVFGITLNNTVLEASCPLDTGYDSLIAFPFDSTTANAGVAMANSFGDQGSETANVAITFYDQSGNNFYSTSMQLAFGQHTAFVLSTQFPQVAGHTGTMVIQALDSTGTYYPIKTLGLRVNLAGSTYTSITPVVPCNGGYDSSGYYLCGN
jgi:hypothetical protein